MKIALSGAAGRATFFRALTRHLADLGHRIVLDDWHDADVVIRVSDRGLFDRGEQEVIEERKSGQITVFWDLDAPATLDRLSLDPSDPLRALLPRYDLVFTSGGGQPVVTRYRSFGARDCVPIYYALDPATHHPVAPRPEFRADLSFLGNRHEDREERIGEFFFQAAARVPHRQFVIAGHGWDDKSLPERVRFAGPVAESDQNAFYCSARAVLNVTRAAMAANGWSPSSRIFEAAGAAACVITDAWEGIEAFLEPGAEVLVAEDGDAVADIIRDLDPARAAAIGKAALRRILAQHTCAHRAGQVNDILESRAFGTRRWPKAG